MAYQRFCKTATLATVRGSRIAPSQYSEVVFDVIRWPNHYENQCS